MPGFFGRIASVFIAAYALIAAAHASKAHAQVLDPGPRGGLAGAGGPLHGLTSAQAAMFAAARARFQEVDSVSGTMPGEPGVGLGTGYNLNSCSGCHAYPAVGGSSPPVNPQVAVATLHGARNVVPPFIQPHGPVREARFVRNPDGSADGGVHDLFVISGRPDAPGCNAVQPNFQAQLAANNVIFRIPTPVYGLGLVEATPDSNLIAAFNAQASLRAALGIGGRFNTSGNDGSITRLGWKAQNKSLLMFAGEAYNVEEGVTNELFPNERDATPGCQFNATPEDQTNLTVSSGSGSPASDYSSDIVNFAMFARLSAPPTPAPNLVNATRGLQVFQAIGCNACHIPTQATGAASEGVTSNVLYHPYSDFALHVMGDNLADGVSQGVATGSEFRTAPLWGAGQRLFFLHDGRASDLVAAVQQHAGPHSEANNVIAKYSALSATDKQSLFAFLRSL